MSEKLPLHAVVDNFNFDQAAKKLLATRKVAEDGNTVTYEEISHDMGDKTLKLRGTHILFEIIHKMANGKCNTCLGKGYFVNNVLKSKVKDPTGQMVLEDEIPEGLSDEQKQIWQAKIEKNPFWRIVNNCTCAVDRFMKKNEDVVVNGFHNIFIRTDYDLVPLEKKAEEPVKVEETKIVEEPKQE